MLLTHFMTHSFILESSTAIRALLWWHSLLDYTVVKVSCAISCMSAFAFTVVVICCVIFRVRPKFCLRAQ